MVSYYNFKALSRVSSFYKFAQSILHHALWNILECSEF